MALGRKTGGRKKGTLNKSTKFSKELINELLSDYVDSNSLKEDLKAIEPKERLDVMVKLMAFVTPKPQSVAIDLNTTDKKITIEDKLAALAQENDSI